MVVNSELTCSWFVWNDLIMLLIFVFVSESIFAAVSVLVPMC
jgi:hypothetical protein